MPPPDESQRPSGTGWPELRINTEPIELLPLPELPPLPGQLLVLHGRNTISRGSKLFRYAGDTPPIPQSFAERVDVCLLWKIDCLQTLSLSHCPDQTIPGKRMRLWKRDPLTSAFTGCLEGTILAAQLAPDPRAGTPSPERHLHVKFDTAYGYSGGSFVWFVEFLDPVREAPEPLLSIERPQRRILTLPGSEHELDF